MKFVEFANNFTKFVEFTDNFTKFMQAFIQALLLLPKDSVSLLFA